MPGGCGVGATAQGPPGPRFGETRSSELRAPRCRTLEDAGTQAPLASELRAGEARACGRRPRTVPSPCQHLGQ
jgi:hypothetical protein